MKSQTEIKIAVEPYNPQLPLVSSSPKGGKHQSYRKEISESELWTKSSDMLTTAKVKEESTNTHLAYSTLLV